jgi:exo-beta-1,3-glucanase (GH17 family)
MKSKGWGGGSFGLALAFAVALTNLLVWQFANRPVDAPEYSGTVTGLAYNAFQRWDAPNTGRYPTNEQINSDLLMLSKLTRRIRTYSSSEFIDLPAIAAQHGMRVTAGVWLDGRFDNNRREIEAVKIAVRHNANIERVIAGNEVLLHGMLTLDQMTAYLRELRRTLRVPVSTAEPWHIWLRYPELARNVDYIVVHLLPFWEGVPAELGVDYALKRFEQMRQAFPDKHIVIGEIGWPSQGERFVAPSGGVAASGPDLQAKFIREFLARSNGKHLDYFLMEAIDQPWKTTSLEGRVGAHWGIFYADRTPKFEFTGPLERDPNWQVKAVASSLLGLLAIAWFARRFSRLRVASRVTYALFVQASASAVVWLLMIPADYYLRPGDWLALAVLLPTLTMMIAIVMAHGFEFAEMFWRGNLQREFGPRPLPDGARQPMVSVHLACCNEQPEVVIATIDSLRRLDYENFEVLVVDNNTRDEALWRPVEAYMSQLGPRFKFFHLPSWPGFKAGALNFALTQTDPAAEVVGVVDADYVVRRDWLRSLVAYFDDPQVAVVQAPQAHRSWARQAFRRMMNWEYDGFFRIGMHHRNERDAIIQHGTMTLIRADALNAHGRWSEWCICEEGRLLDRLRRPRDGRGADARRLRRVQEAAPALGVRRDADPEAPQRGAAAPRTAERRAALPLRVGLAVVVRRCAASDLRDGRGRVDDRNRRGAQAVPLSDYAVPAAADRLLRRQGAVRPAVVLAAGAVLGRRGHRRRGRRHGAVACDRDGRVFGAVASHRRVRDHEEGRQHQSRRRLVGRARGGAAADRAAAGADRDRRDPAPRPARGDAVDGRARAAGDSVCRSRVVHRAVEAARGDGAGARRASGAGTGSAGRVSSHGRRGGASGGRGGCFRQVRGFSTA